MTTRQDIPPLGNSFGQEAYYATPSGLQCIHVLEAFQLGCHRAHAVEYLLRAGKKENLVSDLRKALWWIEREIAIVEQQKRDALADRVAEVAGRAPPPCPDVDGSVFGADEGSPNRSPCGCMGPCTWLNFGEAPLRGFYCKAGENYLR